MNDWTEVSVDFDGPEAASTIELRARANWLAVVGDSLRMSAGDGDGRPSLRFRGQRLTALMRHVGPGRLSHQMARHLEDLLSGSRWVYARYRNHNAI